MIAKTAIAWAMAAGVRASGRVASRAPSAAVPMGGFPGLLGAQAPVYHTSMDKESYRRYLRSPHWLAFKARYRASVRYQCVICATVRHPSRGRRLELHHLTYDRLGRERMTDCVYLCGPHHEAVHAGLFTIGKVRGFRNP